MSFKERFKGKISSINKIGNIETQNGEIPTRCMKPPIPSKKINKNEGKQEAVNKNILPKQNEFIKPTFKISENFDESPIISHKEENFPKDVFCNANPYPTNIEDIMKNPQKYLDEFKENNQTENTKIPVLSKANKPPLKKFERKNSEEILDRKNIRNTAYQQINPININKQENKGQRSSSIPPNIVENRMQSCEISKMASGTKYYALGGLGANIGTEEWNSKKEKLARMTEYSKNVTKACISQGKLDKPPMPPKKVIPQSVEEAKKKKAKMIEYSKQIPKPKKIISEPKTEIEEQNEEPATENNGPEKEFQISEIEKLERQHAEYMEQIEKLKQQYS